MGSKKSSTQTNTTTAYYDQRQVNDAGGGIAGVGNSWDSSTNWLDASQTTWQQFTDTSNRSTNNWQDNSSTNWTQNTDNSNRSTNNWDASNRSTNNWTQNTDASNRSTTNVQVVDGGQTEAARRIAEAAIAAARESSTSAADAARRAQEAAIASGERSTSGALDFAKSNTAAAFKTSTEAMGWAGERFDQLAGLTGDLLKASAKNADSAAANVAGAYSAAASQANGNKTLTIAALAAVGLVAVVVAMKKG